MDSIMGDVAAACCKRRGMGAIEHKKLSHGYDPRAADGMISMNFPFAQCKFTIYIVQMEKNEGGVSIRSRRGAVATFVDMLQQRGRYVFTLKEAQAASGQAAPALRAALRLLESKSRIVKASDRRGFFVIVPHEYTSAGAPPAVWYIGAFMAHLEQPYYIGLLSAAELHGAAHQAPQVFQVITNKPVRGLQVGRQRIEFIVKQHVHTTPVTRVTVHTGYALVSTPAATLLDLVRYPHHGAELNNVATIVHELAPSMRATDLRQALDALDHSPSAQRLGYILDALEHRQLAAIVARWLAKRHYTARKLDPQLLAADTSSTTEPWRIIGNFHLEPDL